MANQFQNESTINQTQSTARVLAAKIKLVRLLSAAAVALFLFAGTAHADILVSNYHDNVVSKYNDDGTGRQDLFAGAATAEGVQCVKLSTNRVYVASFSEPGLIRVYNLTTGVLVDQFTITVPVGTASVIVGLALNASGDILYAAAPQAKPVSRIYAVNVPTGVPGAPCPPTLDPCHADTGNSLDVVVGPDGNVYGTNRFSSGAGVKQFPPVPASGVWSPGSGTVVIPGTSYIIQGTAYSLAHAGAMIFYDGNLWLNNEVGDSTDGIFEFSGPPSALNPNPFRVKNFTPDPGAAPLGMDVSPTNPSAPPVDLCGGCIVVAEFLGKPPYRPKGDVDQIDPHSCTGTIATPGMCQFYRPPGVTTPLITNVNGPKYVEFTDNCKDRGYVEICKMSCLTNPVTGYFTFEATNQGFDSGPLSIPVNACSGPIQVPNGTVTVHETQQLGMLVSNITAYDYDYQGDQISALLSLNLPFQTGNVDVISGDISTETVVGFTNCKSGPGELKICKVAGPGVMVGTDFSFTASGDPATHHVPAGPPPNGYCIVGMSYPVGTPVLVTELPKTGFQVSGITVAPADRGGSQTRSSVIAIIDSGTTEVTFTNIPSGGAGCPTCRLH